MAQVKQICVFAEKQSTAFSTLKLSLSTLRESFGEEPLPYAIDDLVDLLEACVPAVKASTSRFRSELFLGDSYFFFLAASHRDQLTTSTSAEASKLVQEETADAKNQETAASHHDQLTTSTSAAASKPVQEETADAQSKGAVQETAASKGVPETGVTQRALEAWTYCKSSHQVL